MKIQTSNETKLKLQKSTLSLGKQLIAEGHRNLNSHNIGNDEEESAREGQDIRPEKFLTRQEQTKWSRLSNRKKQTYLNDTQKTYRAMQKSVDSRKGITGKQSRGKGVAGRQEIGLSTQSKHAEQIVVSAQERKLSKLQSVKNSSDSKAVINSKKVVSIRGKKLEKGVQVVSSKAVEMGTSAMTGTATAGASVAAKVGMKTANKFKEHVQGQLAIKSEQLKTVQSAAYSKMQTPQIDSFKSGVEVLGAAATVVVIPVMLVAMQLIALVFSILIPALLIMTIVVTIVSVLTALLTLIFAGGETTRGRIENINLSAEVEAHRSVVLSYAKEHGIEEYLPYLLAIMQVESGGRGNDPMQSSESMGLAPNTISNSEESIEAGVRYFASALRLSEAKGTGILSSVQSYNFGTGYIDYVARNGGTHTFMVAESFSREKANGATVRYSNPIAVAKNGGWRYQYGNMFYVELVQQYIQGSNLGSGNVPIYLQGDSAWSAIPYAGTTIGYAGCGLVAAASAFSALTGENIDPATLHQMVGNSCTIGGVNDMGKFAVFGRNRWGLSHTGVLGASKGSIRAMLTHMEQGHLIFASMQGSYPGGVGYIASGHILLLYKDGDTYYMMDPAYKANSRAWELKDLEQINWKYFYAIWNE